MRKTLLNALKHGSGTILILLAMMLGGSLQAWGGTRSFSAGEKIYLANFNPSGWAGTWISSGGTAWIELWNNSSDHVNYEFEYVSGTEYSNRACYAATITGGGSYSNYKIYRGSAVGSSWNSTGEISFGSGDTGKNTIVDFSENGNTATWVASRSFSTGEYLYLRNIKPGVGWAEYWIDSGTQYAYLYMWGGTAGVHTYRFTLVEGTEYAVDAIYGAQIATAGSYAYFILTRGDASCFDGSYPDAVTDATGNVVFDATKNYIYSYDKNVTSVTWDVYDPCNNPTVTAGAYSSLTSSSVTIAATVTAAATDPCAISNVGVDVYSDQACSSSAGVSKEVSYVGSDYSITGVDVSSLSPNVKYYYKTYAKRSSDNAKVYSSNIGSFVMPCLSGVNEATLTSTVETVCLGSATALGVAGSGVVGGVYTYQWYYNSSASTSGAVAIPGATSNSYTPAVVGDNYYYCGIAADGGYCEVPSQFSKLVTIKGVPVITASASSVTNYVPVTLTATGVESTNWSITSGEGGYLYDTNSTTVKFKGNVGSSSDPLTYTIQATSNGCSGTANVTVSRNSDNCQ